ncbi:MAG TPA: VWA domain-containing protein, partial [Candidatus Polarisedimenticolia bacterium]|nr:VWA domain-containing protein [Candidatus Polarisedimenticolia bacterium]
MTSRSLPAALVFAALCLSLALPPLAARTTDRPLRIGGSERVRVDLVLIDVVVRDRKDRPVSGLSKDDFELLVDRLPVPPESMETFEEICAPQEPAGPPSPKAPDPIALSPASPAIAGPAAAAGPARHIVLYFDFSHMTLSGRRQALDAARDYIGVGMTPGDRVMILAFKKDLRLVQEFTSSTSLLAGRLDELIADSATLDSDVLEESQNMH